MTARTRPSWIIANWKMNLAEAQSLAPLPALVAGLERLRSSTTIAVAPSFPALRAVVDRLRATPIWVAAQNVHWEDRGAFTGEVSPPMLVELGVKLVLVGHSERRQLFAETDAQIGKKAVACVRHGLVPAVCVGETDEERRAGRTAEVVTRQVSIGVEGIPSGSGQLLIAYEPVWAIGTGRTASAAQAQEVHALIRRLLFEKHGAERAESTPILYGGSVTPENARELLALPDVDGALVGGASLNPGNFLSIAGSTP